MSKTVKTSIGSTLASKTNAKALSQLQMGKDCTITVWTNSHGLVTYDQAEGHTFSFYLAGGEGVERIDRNKAQGWPGSICIFPEGHCSDWEVTDRIDFLHVYLSDEELRRQFAHMFDKDARLLDVREHVFIESDQLAVAFKQVQHALCEQSPMFAEEAVSTLICESMAAQVLGDMKRPVLTGGLLPKKLNLVKDYVAENLSEAISLKELAALVNLSEYHFQRNFKAQCGVSPHIWLTKLRIEHAKELIRQKQNLAEIATACAFSSQSHFSRTFKKYTGTTPGAYIRSIF